MSVNKARMYGEKPEDKNAKVQSPEAARAVVKKAEKEKDADTAPWKGGIDKFGEGVVS